MILINASAVKMIRKVNFIQSVAISTVLGFLYHWMVKTTPLSNMQIDMKVSKRFFSYSLNMKALNGSSEGGFSLLIIEDLKIRSLVSIHSFCLSVSKS